MPRPRSSALRPARIVPGVVAVAAALTGLAAPAAGAATVHLATPRTPRTAPLPVTRDITHGTVIRNPQTAAPWVLPLLHVDKSLAADPVPQAYDASCSSSAISDREIITAAHCVVEPGLYYVMVGGSRMTSGHAVPVEVVRYNSRYSSTRIRNDIAVLRTLVPLGLPSYAKIGTASLARKVTSARPPALRIYGWGKPANTTDPDGFLRTVAVHQLDSTATKLFGSGFDPHTQIAVGSRLRNGRYAGTCQGDSGGPLVVKVGRASYVVGVTSYGLKAGCDMGPSVFTSVGAFSAWAAQARKSLPALAKTANRALPYALTAPTLSTNGGAPVAALGQPITCNAPTGAQLTENATVAGVSFLRNGSTQVPAAAGGVHVVEAADADAQLACVVTLHSSVGSTSVTSAAFTFPAAPDAYVTPVISGLAGDGSMPVPGTVATCAATFTVPGVSVGYDWFASSSSVDLTGATPLATGAASLTLTTDVLKAAAGRELVCRATGSNGMGSSQATTGSYIPSLRAPYLSGLAVNGTVARNSPLTCAATPSDATAVVSYRWARSAGFLVGSGPLPATAAVIAGQTGPSYTTTNGAPDTGNYLTCEVTATTWQGTSVAYESTFSRIP
ncbi:trypsin-like serine protease [Motilibacter rhizosphaerae]|uniref:trypsin-like serine protease n=1 Tax=Motilibacter rhizosphaerae TaxID=598652 RepID=UPI0013EE656F|nr:trypsin-like serine protease [Motilibacter rhizosphaerae]